MNISKDSFDMFDEQERIFYFILPEDSEKALSLWSYTDNSVIFRPFTIKPGSPEQTSELQTNNCCLQFTFLVTKWLFPENTIFYEYLCFRT